MVDRSEDSNNSSIEEIRFNELFLEVLDNSLTHILGEAAKETLFVYLKTVFFLDRENIGRKPTVFDAGLKMLFGSSATVIEKVIVRELFSRMGLKSSKNDTFVDLVEEARTYFILNEKWLSRAVEMS